MSSSCILCDHDSVEFLVAQKPFPTKYLRCSNCDLVFMDSHFFLEPDNEKERYLEHNNDINDPRYVDFLNKLIIPMKEYIDRDLLGLDYGSGPSPVLVELMQRDGYQIKGYDPFFSSIDLREKYDYILSTEVVEHFNNPKDSFKKLIGLLKPGSYLGVMTSILYPDINFDKWYYRHDNTHVSFYTPKTLKYLESTFGLEKLHSTENIIIWKKI